MALQAAQAQQQATPSPSPSRAPSPTREGTGSGEWPGDVEKLPTAGAASPDDVELVVVASTHHAAAAKYVPPRATSHTADPNPGGGGSAGWYSWNGGRTLTAATPRHARPDPTPPRRQQPVEAPPPPPPAPAPALPPATPPAPAPAQVPPTAPAPAPQAPSPHVQFRSADQVVPNIVSRKRRAAAMQRTALLARGAAAALCLAALAVLAADTRKGWARDSYSNYTQFRYSEAVNVIGFLYSVFQFVALAEFMRRNKQLIPHPKRDLFDFTMDQVLAYLLISSSSSATARVSDLIDNWGSDPFPSMANGSITISFLAFAVFAICSLISAYNLFRRDV
ncbi:CASP-like protein 4A1 [Miscanthus floridulus]|uniref:CASP-like protein 4A1 n=1 Tax=Miscanthus floridulus TaxID=154761 RepID=UPI00345AFF99